jgi:hypothetical protein
MYQLGSSEKPKKLVSDVADFDAPLMFVQPETMLKHIIANSVEMRRNTDSTQWFYIKRRRIPESELHSVN